MRSQDDVYALPLRDPSPAPSVESSRSNTPHTPYPPAENDPEPEESEPTRVSTPEAAPALSPQDATGDGSQVESGESSSRSRLYHKLVGSTDHPSHVTPNCDLPVTAYPIPSPPPADHHVPACRRLIDRAFTPSDVVPLIGAVFMSRDELQLVSEFRGDDAQTFIDVIFEVRLHAPSFLGYDLIVFVLFCYFLGLSPPADQALDLPDLPPRLRKKCLTALCKICGRQGLLPRSLQIPLCYNRSETPLYRGGYADVWKGEHQSCHVAVKVLRVYTTSDFDKITSVGSRILSKVVRWPADVGRYRNSVRRSLPG